MKTPVKDHQKPLIERSLVTSMTVRQVASHVMCHNPLQEGRMSALSGQTRAYLHVHLQMRQHMLVYEQLLHLSCAQQTDRAVEKQFKQL